MRELLGKLHEFIDKLFIALKDPWEYQELSQAMKSLEANGEIAKTVKDGREYWYLTEKGTEHAKELKKK